MNIELAFSSITESEIFANKHKLPISGTSKLIVDWHLLNIAKQDTTVTQISQIDTTEHEFVVSCNDVSQIANLSTVLNDLGNGFYHIKSTNGVAISNLVQSVEITSLPVKFLAVSSPLNLNGTTSNLDPTSSEAQWARIRVASRYRPLISSFRTHEVNYKSIPQVYIMDSGINFNHPEFDDPNILKENFYTLPRFNGNFDDDVGHGTSMASSIAGKNLGIAGKCKLLNVKMGDSTGSSTIIELGLCIDAILARVVENTNKTHIVNMSWGINRSTWLDNKILSLIDAGVTVVCAAGNSGIDVELITPAGLDQVITVGSIDKFDIPSGFNNISPTDSGLTTSSGLSLDIFAPGEDIVVADKNNQYVTACGTSCSAAIVSGVLTEIASLFTNTVYYTQLRKIMFDTATEHALLFDTDKFSENQNRLIYLATADENANYKDENLVSYMGVHGNDPNDKIIADLNSCIYLGEFKKIFPNENFVYSFEFLDQTIQSQYSQFMNVDSSTGILTIDKPTVPLPEEVKLKMIEFIAVVTSPSVTLRSNTLFYFVNNPLYHDTLDSDITLALTDLNSISYFGNWTPQVLK